MLDWATSACHKDEGAALHPGACTHNLQYEGRPGGRFWVWVMAWNLGSLSGKGGEVCEELRKRMIDMCCLQEVRWNEQGTRMLGIKQIRYKLWWSGKGDGVGGVRVMVYEEQCE